MRRLASAALATLIFSSAAFAELDTFTYVSHDGGGSGAFEGDMSAQNPVSVFDSVGGDMWNGGDQYAFLHQGAAIPVGSSYTAMVRVISQTQHLDGRWGKAGIVAAENLGGLGGTAVAQVAFGNGSQAYPNSDGTWVGGESPVPVRLGGRTQSDGQGGFEDGIVADAAYTGPVNDGGEVMNVLESRWLSLQYDAATNQFTAGVARDVNGSPGVWNYSAARDNIPINASGGQFIGIGYSAHGDLNADQITRPDGLHGVTFDRWSLEVVPEPSAVSLFAFAVLGMLGFRRRQR